MSKRGLIDTVSYLVAYDKWGVEARDAERAVLAEHGVTDKDALPLDAGVSGAAEIYGIRFGAIVKATGATVLRLTGVDAAYGLTTDTPFPRNNKESNS